MCVLVLRSFVSVGYACFSVTKFFEMFVCASS